MTRLPMWRAPIRTVEFCLAFFLAALLTLSLTAGGTALLAQEPSRPDGTLPESLARQLDAESVWTIGPTDWVKCPTTVSANVVDTDGLQPDTSQFRYSTDGGATWSAWMGSPQVQYTAPNTTTVNITTVVNDFVDSASLNQVQFRITDNTTNVETSPVHTVRVDNAAPPAPMGLMATPSGWTNVDSFALTWSNPLDLTGIVRAYYKIGNAPPTGPDDWTGRRDGPDIRSIVGIALGAPGVKVAYVWLEDALGNRNHQNYSQVTLSLDQQAPAAVSSLTVVPSTWTNTNLFALQWSNPPAQAAPIWRAYYKFDTPPAHAGDYSGYREGLGISQITGLAAPSPGEIPCYVWLGDQAGNADHTTATGAVLRYAGTQAPDPPFALQIQPAGWTTNNSFTATWTNPAWPAGICAVWYKWGTPPAHVTDGTRVAGEGIQELPNLQAPAEGQNTLYVWLEDCAGNRDHTKRSSATAQLDFTPPQTMHSYEPALPTSGWFVGDVTVRLQATDAHSGVRETLWRQEGGLARPGDSFLATDYRIVYQYWSIDNAGNEESPITLTVPIDKEPPTSTLTLTPPEPAGGWYSSTVTVQITAEDKLSGWVGDTWYRLDEADWIKGTQFTIDENGSHTVVYYSRDKAGNYELSPYKTRVVRIDKVPPTVMATADKTGPFVQTPVVITIQASDTHSGIQAVEYRLQGETTWSQGDTILIPDGAHDGAYTYDYRARDAANNQAMGQITVTIDTTSPPPPQNPTLTPNKWVNQNGIFGVCWANPADVSGIAGVYYQLDVDPAQNATSATFVAGSSIQCLSNLSVPGEGSHTLYLWLRDGAGNSDPFTRIALADAFRLDTTAPTCVTPLVSGPAGDNGYYTGPVTVTMRAEDTLSGLSTLRYRVNSGAWNDVPTPGNPSQFTHVIPLNADGRHVIEYTANDRAGNASATCTLTVYIDSLPPTSPQDIAVTPAGWTASNNFALSWRNPDDYAGIAGIYVKKGSPPTADDDGEYYPRNPGQTSLSGLTTDAEGETTVYLWLRDRAGNVDKSTAVSATLRHDATPPNTTLTVTGNTRNGYYISAATLRFTIQDGASGVANTFYKINEAPTWTPWLGEDIVLDREGTFTVSYYSVDRADNQEAAKTTSSPLRIDLQPPTGALTVSADYRGAADACLEISWSGADTMSGVEKYDVQYRRGGCGNWVNWRADTANVGDIFCNLEPNNFYYFRVRAKDRAGWASDWSAPKARNSTYKEGLANPDFELGAPGAWVISGGLGGSIVQSTGPDGSLSYMAKLSKAQWGSNPAWIIDEVPVNAYGSIRQSITLPSLDCDQGLLLTFWYKIEGYDAAWGLIQGANTPEDPSDDVEGIIDTFDVYIRDANGRLLAIILRDGNYEQKPAPPYPIISLPWKYAMIDLTPWAGRTIQIDFQVWNRNDEWYPTWAYIENVRLLPTARRIMSLPLVLTDKRPRPSRVAPIEVKEPSPWPVTEVLGDKIPPRR
ncbi:MAG: fibronectin type III domain-containing protein [Chloroflexi bacterium]|nr:fibronectin type III domain-containing protein [Chloroflexota bacterium]